MPYAAHTRYQLFGSVFDHASAREEFVMTLNTDRVTAPTQAEVDAFMTIASTWYTHIDMRIGAEHFLNGVKASLCDATNHVVGVAVVSNPSLFVVGPSTELHPPQVAARASLNGTGRGRSKQGGFYVPSTGAAYLDTEMGYGVAVAGGMALRTKVMLAALELAGAGAPVIASKTLGNVPVTQIRFSAFFDTIRRRRDDLSNQYGLAQVYP